MVRIGDGDAEICTHVARQNIYLRGRQHEKLALRWKIAELKNLADKGEGKVINAMKSTTRKLLFGAALAVSLPASANAYEVDCAILLCLSGGWPASAECSHARAVFIQRITPSPIEPPLQIWRCPMGAAMNLGPAMTPSERLRSVVNEDSSELFHRVAVEISEENGIADIDVSGSEFDFVRSIKVWNVLHYSHRKVGRNEECREQSTIQLGTYGTQGEFQWAPSGPSAAPDWVIPSRSCEPGSHARAVGVEWEDFAGNHGFEVVNY